MKKLVCLMVTLILLVYGKAFAATKVSGKINKDTLWTLKQSPYLVTKTVTVKPNARLTIEPGVNIQFSSKTKKKTKLVIEGNLSAEGTPGQIIKFTSDDIVKPKQWNGIIFNKSGNSTLAYTQIEGATSGVACFYSSPKIYNSKFINNEVGIVCEDFSSPEIVNNQISENGNRVSSPGGISCNLYSSPKISNNVIEKNVGNGITTSTFSSPRIENNTIYHNEGHGILTLSLSDPIIINNDVAFNGSSCGITCYQSSPVIMGNKVHDNKGHGISTAIGGTPIIVNNDINNNGAGIAVVASSPKIFFNTLRENNASISILYKSKPVINYNQMESYKDHVLKLEKACETIDARNNWWGMTDIPSIENNILGFSRTQVQLDPIKNEKITLEEYSLLSKNLLLEKRQTAAIANYPWQILDNKILFSSYRDGNWEIYLTNNNGTLLKNLTNNPANDEWPNWSPDGKKVIFTSKREKSENTGVYVLTMNENLSLNKISKIDNINKEYATWSPKGDKISFRDEFDNLYIMENNGKNKVSITSAGLIAKDYPGFQAILNVWLQTE